jgi:glycosyltransferase involved in cell wall biosynthesis
MKVNLAVSGRFHYYNVVPYLYRHGVLNRFYYAHRITTGEKSLGVPAGKLVNVWIKEYLLQAHSRMPWIPGLTTLTPMYRRIWESVSLANWSAGDLLHILLHGGGRRIIRRAHSDGAVVIGEPVNAHPDFQNEILRSERDRLKIPSSVERSPEQRQMIEEFGMCDRFLVASNFIKRTFVEKGYDESKIDVLHYGVDVNRFPIKQGLVPYDKTFRVICVASISVRKGIIDLLEAWKRLAVPDGELVLIGRVNPEMNNVLRSYDGLFTHIPFVPNQGLSHYYKESTVFVLPSLEDGFGLVCGEAMASGLPVIATTNMGVAEIIDDGVDGYIVPIRSPDAIAERLLWLYRDREKAFAMGRDAARKMRSLNGWEGYTQQLIEIYGGALS